jgi:hypothetical protein
MKVVGVSFFLSHGLYGQRPMSHRDCYLRAPGWLSLELGSWTLEIDWPAKRTVKQQPTEVQQHEGSVL